MNDHQIVIGIFENEFYAIIAKRELKEAGIKANIIKEMSGINSYLIQQTEGVQVVVSDTQIEEAKKILLTKFI